MITVGRVRIVTGPRDITPLILVLVDLYLFWAPLVPNRPGFVTRSRSSSPLPSLLFHIEMDIGPIPGPWGRRAPRRIADARRGDDHSSTLSSKIILPKSRVHHRFFFSDGAQFSSVSTPSPCRLKPSCVCSIASVSSSSWSGPWIGWVRVVVFLLSVWVGWVFSY